MFRIVRASAVLRTFPLVRQAAFKHLPACFDKVKASDEGKKLAKTWFEGKRDELRCLEYDEFSKFISEINADLTPEEKDQVFDFFDRDHTGDISYDQLMSAVMGLPISHTRSSSLDFL
ncbi:hypothetical protein DIPPA_02034 [Diplonema papillatum]|nr:hypothetical protein DIPPA_02034 [Diplonema papillatum]|eukprot:gene2041-3125_t